jgi:hypothetical protein
MDTWTGISDPNHFPDDYDYVHLIPSGAGVTDAISGTFEFPQGMFYIDGDFRAGSAVQIWSGTTLLMKAGAGILAETKLTISGGWTSPAVIDGLNGVSWKGIACTPDASISISGGTIKNAGASTFNFPNFQTEANAAVYISGKSNISFSLSDFKIINSDGYGVYFDVQGTLQTSIFKGQISNTALAGIRLTAQTANYAIGSYTEIEFQMNPGVPAVLVEGQGSPSSLTWQSLGTGNYYLVDADLDFGTVRMRLNAGVHLKMASGRALVFNGDNPVFFEAFGTAENPIIIEGEDGTPGSWGGIYIESASFRMQHCTIKNGGEFILPGASEPANFVNNSRESFGTYLIQNCTFSGSAGYGFVEEYNIRNPYDVLAPELENTFSNNALGDFIKKEGGI